MLTEIEWWGGLLVLWSLACYRFTWSTIEDKTSGDFIIWSITFAASLALLVLYFYPMESQLHKQTYVVLLLVGVAFMALSYIWPESEQVKDISKTTEDEVEPVYEVLGHVIYLIPVLVPFGLGAYKSWGYVDSLGWFV